MINLNKQPLLFIFFLIRSTTKDLLILGLADFHLFKHIIFWYKKINLDSFSRWFGLHYLQASVSSCLDFSIPAWETSLKYLKWPFCPTVTLFAILRLPAELIVLSSKPMLNKSTWLYPVKKLWICLLNKHKILHL